MKDVAVNHFLSLFKTSCYKINYMTAAVRQTSVFIPIFRQYLRLGLRNLTLPKIIALF
jgi:hypothetical protein